MAYTKTFDLIMHPKADDSAIVEVGNARFTILTSRMIRMEFDPASEFEDRASQVFWYRQLSVPEFESNEDGGILQIETEALSLKYCIGQEFAPETLLVTLKETGGTWKFGEMDPLNLGGTYRTLDDVDGALNIEEGLLSRSGYTVVDDSGSLVFDEEGWLTPRKSDVEFGDLYFLGYGADADGCLKEYSQVAGTAPLLPRWALGNWWSRYWAYSDEELLALMDEFKDNEVPLSVCIVDMDWHLTETGNKSSGWTGYTWNRDLFPEPEKFIAELHRRGLRTALNLHPAEGIHSHEEMYEEMACAVGDDPESKEPVRFDISDKEFTKAYFEYLHHPKEAEGIDFWWMDWQQGEISGLRGLDPLWWLNHLHFFDLEREGKKRPFVFSRWGGLGNHRYPIGFSGDTHITWDSLAFQPFFTATAANVNYGWWSHDIGGHMGGIEDAELFTRWVQFGVFSPIFRLHCTNNAVHERRPWGWDAETSRLTSDAMRLRHRLIPYLYSMSWRNHQESLPLIRPMYHLNPEKESAYRCDDQYWFGSELVAAPFVKPMDEDLRVSKQVVWLPKGRWMGLFDGIVYEGEGWYPLYGGLDEIPVFAKEGAIVPISAGDGLTNPEAFEVHLFSGANNEFCLYEDDGLNESSLIKITQAWGDDWRVDIQAVEGKVEHLPRKRTWTLMFRGVQEDVEIESNREYSRRYDSELRIQVLEFQDVGGLEGLSVILKGVVAETLEGRVQKTCEKLVKAFRMESWSKQALLAQLLEIVEEPARLEDFILKLTSSQAKALIEVLSDAGSFRTVSRRTGDELLIAWNNQDREDVGYKLSALDVYSQPITRRGILPNCSFYEIGEKTVSYQDGSGIVQGRMSIESWFDNLEDQFAGAEIPDGAVIQFEITGRNGRVSFLELKGEEAILSAGLHLEPILTIKAGEEEWLKLINGDAPPLELVLGGMIEIEGQSDLALQLAESIQIVSGDVFLADHWQLEIDYLGVLRKLDREMK